MRQKFERGEMWLGDCLELMADIPDGSVDLVLCDLPYGTTQNKWDAVIPFAPLWAHYWRVAKPNAAIVLTAAQPFTTALIGSALQDFKYEWIYEKTNPKGFLNAKSRPLSSHENICVFSETTHAYYPQKWQVPEYLRTKRKHATSKTAGDCYGNVAMKRWDDDGSRFPTSVVGFSNRVGRDENYHPTQKPVALFEYLIRTYTQPGELVLDNCSGSGTTAVAAHQTDRRYLCIERDMDYYFRSLDRVAGL